LQNIVVGNGFPTDGIVIDDSRPTTVKTRIIAHSQHVVRIDQEGKEDLKAEIQAKVLASLERQIFSLDGIILEDYNKGVFNEGVN